MVTVLVCVLEPIGLAFRISPKHILPCHQEEHRTYTVAVKGTVIVICVGGVGMLVET